MSFYSEQMAAQWPLLLASFGEGVTVKVAPSSEGVDVTAIVSNPQDVAQYGQPWNERAESVFVRIDADAIEGIVAGESILTIRGKDYSVLSADLGEGAIWRLDCARADVSIAGRGRR
jgi:hypothetical protein